MSLLSQLLHPWDQAPPLGPTKSARVRLLRAQSKGGGSQGTRGAVTQTPGECWYHPPATTGMLPASLAWHYLEARSSGMVLGLAQLSIPRPQGRGKIFYEASDIAEENSCL